MVLSSGLSPDLLKDALEGLGPLRVLAGVWEGTKGDDTAPSDDRGIEKNQFRERMVFDPIGRVDNHEQILYGLRYATTAWRIGEDKPFHEEVGYWLWDAKAKQAMRCFIVPRGVTVLAGGTVEKDAKQFRMSARIGSPTYGICSNVFLDIEFKTVGYELEIIIHNENSFSYEEDSQLILKGKTEIFHHKDSNTMHRVSSVK